MKNIAKAEVLKLSKTKEIIFSVAFTAMAVYAPMLVHYFGGVDAGRKFLPMPFFVLLAGLALGWRAGLVTGLASPIISYMLSGMPMLPILPIIIVQLCTFGFSAGLLREKYNTFVSLAGAIVLGFLAMGLAVLFFSKMNVAVYILSAARDGWIGILFQLAILPIILKLVNKTHSYEEQI